LMRPVVPDVRLAEARPDRCDEWVVAQRAKLDALARRKAGLALHQNLVQQDEALRPEVER
jgi:hypothetical protein